MPRYLVLLTDRFAPPGHVEVRTPAFDAVGAIASRNCRTAFASHEAAMVAAAKHCGMGGRLRGWCPTVVEAEGQDVAGLAWDANRRPACPVCGGPTVDRGAGVWCGRCGKIESCCDGGKM